MGMGNLMHHRAPSAFRFPKLGNMAFVAFITVALFSPVVLQSLFGTGLSPVLSNSMSPAFSAGDLLITVPVAADQIAPGDVIVVRDDQSYVTFAHRVLKRDKIGSTLKLITQGDANPAADEKPVVVDPAVTLPKVSQRVPFVGAPLVFFGTSLGRTISIGFLVLAGTLLLVQFRLNRKRQQRETNSS
jgi:signal peptidase I